MKPLVIIGSARKDGHTKKLVDQLFKNLDHDRMDLLAYRIHPYDYSNNYPENDQFLQLMEHFLKHRTIVFATPVYWYAMSGPMKIFFDRLTDLITVKKELGRQLKGKRTFLISVGGDNALPTGFEVPFQQTSSYLGMEFIATYYCKGDQLNAPLEDAHAFMEKIKL